MSRRRSRTRGSLPKALAPQLAVLVSQPPKGKGWVHEIRFDGYRLLAFLEGGVARLSHDEGMTGRMPSR